LQNAFPFKLQKRGVILVTRAVMSWPLIPAEICLESIRPDCRRIIFITPRRVRGLHARCAPFRAKLTSSNYLLKLILLSLQCRATINGNATRWRTNENLPNRPGSVKYSLRCLQRFKYFCKSDARFLVISHRSSSSPRAHTWRARASCHGTS
jgi:hypothetical protein